MYSEAKMGINECGYKLPRKHEAKMRPKHMKEIFLPKICERDYVFLI